MSDEKRATWVRPESGETAYAFTVLLDERDRLASLLGRCVPFIRNNTRHPLGCPACGVDGCAFHGPCECGLTALLADLLTEMEP